MFEIVTLSKIHDIFDPLVMSQLGEREFQAVTRATWLRSADAPIRQIFSIVQWKGGKIAPVWGLSLDFVPHLSGKNIRWHRTPKSAMFDLRIDSRDRDLDISYMKGPDEIIRRAPSVASNALAKAISFWDKHASLEALPSAVKHMREHLSSGGLGFYNYTQAPIAAAFIFAKNGMETEGMVELNRFLEGRDVDAETNEKLSRLFNDATADNDIEVTDA